MKKTGKTTLCLTLLLWMLVVTLVAQDLQPLRNRPNLPATNGDTLKRSVHRRSYEVVEPTVVLPSTFREAKPNVLTDSLATLDSFFAKLKQLLVGTRKDSVRIVHIGDSHVRGHIFPQTVGERLKQLFGGISYIDVGLNGAFSQTFSRPERIAPIAALNPDLLILSFGTNESHNRRYNSRLHFRHLSELVDMLREALPDTPMLLTTPPGSYTRGGTRRRRTYSINPRTALVTQTILHFGHDYGVAVWDLYDVAGDGRRAAANWWEAGLMRPDHIHFSPQGYELQGNLLYQALIHGYNDYVDY
jgi:lysophospholipase L1-like esterase